MKKVVVLVILSLVSLTLSACTSGEPSTPTPFPPAATSAPATDVIPTPFQSPTPVEGEIEEAPQAEIISLELAPEATEARFVIGEILRGQDNTVVGSTDQVQGEIRIDPNRPDQSTLGTFQIDAGSFTTDSGMRDRAIANFILQSGDYETITFEAISISGIPEDANLEQTLNLQIQGNLTIREVTRQITFEATVTPVSKTRLEGSASATILREDFELGIPSVPSVASVDDEVTLEIDLVAWPVGGS
jgi:polyisoprenoid-binding protein YceI